MSMTRDHCDRFHKKKEPSEALSASWNQTYHGLIGASIVHKQFKKNGDPETKLLPFPAMEVKISKYAVLNLSG